MRKLGILSLVVAVALVAGSAYGTGQMNPTLGFNVFWYGADGSGGTSTWSNFYIFESTRGVGYSEDLNKALVNQIVSAPVSNGGWGFSQTYFNCYGPDMFDPRADKFTGAALGGTGKTTIWTHAQDGVGGNTANNMWSIANLTPGGSYALAFKGGSGVTGVYGGNLLLRAPDNLLGTNSHGLAYFSANNNQGNVYYQYDANGDGVIDNTPSERIGVGNPSAGNTDLQFGPDKALYGINSTAGQRIVQREYFRPTGTTATQTLFNESTVATTSDGLYVLQAGDSGGIALGKSHTNGVNSPIVYMGALTFGQDEDCSLINSTRISIIAMQDMNGDNSIDLTNDCVTLVWRSNRFGVKGYQSNSEPGGVNDIEYDPVAQNLVVSSSWDSFLVLSLDNTTGMTAIAGRQFGGINNGNFTHSIGGRFVLDSVPFASADVPEPATLLLLGSGVLGVVGYARRRMMK